MRTDGTGSNEAATLAVVGDATEPAAPALRAAGGPVRRRLAVGWQLTRHLLEMVAAMAVGMAALGLATGWLGEPPGSGNALVAYGLMGASMSLPMVAWMRYRGHSWSDGGEMTAAMLVPMVALLLPVELGAAALDGHLLMMLAHVAMIAGMVALMIYRRERYAGGAHGHHA